MAVHCHSLIPGQVGIYNSSLIHDPWSTVSSGYNCCGDSKWSWRELVGQVIRVRGSRYTAAGKVARKYRTSGVRQIRKATSSFAFERAFERTHERGFETRIYLIHESHLIHDLLRFNIHKSKEERE